MTENIEEIELHNPYYDEVRDGVTEGSLGRFSAPERLRNKNGDFKVKAKMLERREELVKEYAWAIPHRKAVREIVEHPPVLEVGAGNGYWAYLVEQLGGDIVATELDPPEDTWTDVIEMDAVEAVREYSSEYTLFMCWMPYDDSVAADALEEYDGYTVICVGEGSGGCTADDRFHNILASEFRNSETIAIPQYYGLHDMLQVWVR